MGGAHHNEQREGTERHPLQRVERLPSSDLPHDAQLDWTEVNFCRRAEAGLLITRARRGRGSCEFSRCSCRECLRWGTCG